MNIKECAGKTVPVFKNKSRELPHRKKNSAVTINTDKHTGYSRRQRKALRRLIKNLEAFSSTLALPTTAKTLVKPFYSTARYSRIDFIGR